MQSTFTSYTVTTVTENIKWFHVPVFLRVQALANRFYTSSNAVCKALASSIFTLKWYYNQKKFFSLDFKTTGM